MTPSKNEQSQGKCLKRPEEWRAKKVSEKRKMVWETNDVNKMRKVDYIQSNEKRVKVTERDCEIETAINSNHKKNIWNLFHQEDEENFKVSNNTVVKTDTHRICVEDPSSQHLDGLLPQMEWFQHGEKDNGKHETSEHPLDAPKSVEYIGVQNGENKKFRDLNRRETGTMNFTKVFESVKTTMNAKTEPKDVSDETLDFKMKCFHNRGNTSLENCEQGKKLTLAPKMPEWYQSDCARQPDQLVGKKEVDQKEVIANKDRNLLSTDGESAEGYRTKVEPSTLPLISRELKIMTQVDLESGDKNLIYLKELRRLNSSIKAALLASEADGRAKEAIHKEEIRSYEDQLKQWTMISESAIGMLDEKLKVAVAAEKRSETLKFWVTELKLLLDIIAGGRHNMEVLYAQKFAALEAHLKQEKEECETASLIISEKTTIIAKAEEKICTLESNLTQLFELILSGNPRTIDKECVQTITLLSEDIQHETNVAMEICSKLEDKMSAVKEAGVQVEISEVWVKVLEFKVAVKAMKHKNDAVYQKGSKDLKHKDTDQKLADHSVSSLLLATNYPVLEAEKRSRLLQSQVEELTQSLNAKEHEAKKKDIIYADKLKLAEDSLKKKIAITDSFRASLQKKTKTVSNVLEEELRKIKLHCQQNEVRLTEQIKKLESQFWKLSSAIQLVKRLLVERTKSLKVAEEKVSTLKKRSKELIKSKMKLASKSRAQAKMWREKETDFKEKIIQQATSIESIRFLLKETTAILTAFSAKSKLLESRIIGLRKKIHEEAESREDEKAAWKEKWTTRNIAETNLIKSELNQQRTNLETVRISLAEKTLALAYSQQEKESLKMQVKQLTRSLSKLKANKLKSDRNYDMKMKALDKYDEWQKITYQNANSTLDKNTKMITEAKETINMLMTRIKELTDKELEIEAWNKEKKAMEAQAADLRTTVKELEENVFNKQSIFTTAEQKSRALQLEIKNLVKMFTTAKASNRALSQAMRIQIRRLKNVNDTLVSELNEQKCSAGRASESERETLLKLVKTKEQVKKLQTENRKLESQLVKAQSAAYKDENGIKIELLKSEKSKLKAILASKASTQEAAINMLKAKVTSIKSNYQIKIDELKKEMDDQKSIDHARIIDLEAQLMLKWRAKAKVSSIAKANRLRYMKPPQSVPRKITSLGESKAGNSNANDVETETILKEVDITRNFSSKLKEQKVLHQYEMTNQDDKEKWPVRLSETLPKAFEVSALSSSRSRSLRAAKRRRKKLDPLNREIGEFGVRSSKRIKLGPKRKRNVITDDIFSLNQLLAYGRSSHTGEATSKTINNDISEKSGEPKECRNENPRKLKRKLDRVFKDYEAKSTGSDSNDKENLNPRSIASQLPKLRRREGRHSLRRPTFFV